MSQLDLSGMSGSMWKFPGSPHDTSVWRHSGHMPPHPPHPGHPPPDSRSRSRDRSRVDLEQRRRAQSKSPARRQAVNQKYSDNAPDISGLSRMFRDFSGAVRAKMAKKSDTAKLSMSSTMSDLPDPAQLKSNLKKQKNNIGSDVTDNSPNNDKVSNSAADNKKVHFNKFATVQMMG